MDVGNLTMSHSCIYDLFGGFSEDEPQVSVGLPYTDAQMETADKSKDTGTR